jgi:hypothetical protein
MQPLLRDDNISNNNNFRSNTFTNNGENGFRSNTYNPENGFRTNTFTRTISNLGRTLTAMSILPDFDDEFTEALIEEYVVVNSKGTLFFF